jgi:hypothetical protein
MRKSSESKTLWAEERDEDCYPCTQSNLLPIFPGAQRVHFGHMGRTPPSLRQAVTKHAHQFLGNQTAAQRARMADVLPPGVEARRQIRKTAFLQMRAVQLCGVKAYDPVPAADMCEQEILALRTEAPPDLLLA